MDFQTMKEGKSGTLLLILLDGVNYNSLLDHVSMHIFNYLFRWGFLPVYGDDEYLSICEMPIEEVGINYYPYLFIPKYVMYL